MIFRKVLASLVVAAFLALTAGVLTWAYNQGHFAPPADRVVRPVSIQVYGPTTSLRGESAYFTAITEGETGKPSWQLVPATAGALTILPDGHTAHFRSLDEGVFSIIVSVAGDKMQVASAHTEFDNVDPETIAAEYGPPPEHEPQPQPQQQLSLLELAQSIANQPPEPEPEPPSVTDLTLGAFDQIESEDKVAEARMVAGCIRSVIGRIETGLMAPDADPMAEVERQVNAALGERSAHWTLFLVSLRSIFDSLRDQGHVTTAASSVSTLAEISGTLLKVK